MTANEAYNIIKDSVGTRNIIACIEYDDCYLFPTIPADYKPMTEDGKPNVALDSTYLVDKQTGESSVFNPLIRKVIGEYKIIEDFR